MQKAFPATKPPLRDKSVCALHAMILLLALFSLKAAKANPEIAVYNGSDTGGTERIHDISVHSFRNYPIGSTSAPQTFVVRNAGTTALSLSGVTLAGHGSSHFTLDTSGLATSIAPGENTSFSIAFSPSKTGLLQAIIQITSDDADETPFRIHLAGHGQPAGEHKVVGWGSEYLGRSDAPATLTGVTAIAAGGSHSLAVKSDGTVVGWGGNGSGETNVPSGLTGVVAVSAGTSHSLALKSDGTVVAWGWNGSGVSTVPSELAGVVAVSAGRHHSLALKSDGTVIAWGWGGNGECTIPSGLNDAVAVSSGSYFSMALKKDGTVIAWGWNGNGECTIPSGLSDVVAVSAGENFCLALKRDGRVVAWGGNDDGQRNVPTGLAGVVALDTSLRHCVALTDDGRVVAWGNNTNGQTQIPSSLENAVAVDAGGSHCLALGHASDITVHAGSDTDGAALVTGSGTQDLGASFAGGTGLFHTFTIRNTGTRNLQLAVPTLTGTHPSQFLLSTANYSASIAPGDTTSFTVALQPTSRGSKTATLSIASNSPTKNPFLIYLTGVCTSSIALHSGAGTSGGTLTDNVGSHVFRNCPTGGSSTFDSLTVQNTGTTSLRISGISLGGKDSSQYTLDTSSLATSLAPGASASFKVAFTPTRIGLQRALIQVATDNPSEIPFRVHLFGHGLTTVEQPVIAWGYNSRSVMNVPPDLTGAVALAAGYYHALALRKNGTVVAWGSTNKDLINVPSDLTGVVAVAAAAYHNLALKSDGTVVAWGVNTSGQSSVPVGLTEVAAISAGQYHSLALKSDGTVVAWGGNFNEQCDVPAGLSGVVAITASEFSSLAVKSDGSIVKWGADFYTSQIPSDVTGVVALASGLHNVMALKGDGTIMAWGAFINQWSVPADLSGVVSLASGWYHSLVLKADGTVLVLGEPFPIRYDNVGHFPSGMIGVSSVAAGYEFSLALGHLVKPLPQTLTFSPPTTLYVGQTLDLGAWASSGLQVSLSKVSGPGTLSKNQLTATAAGTLKITASQAGGGQHLAATSITRTIVVKAAPTTLTLLGLTQTYDGSPKAVTVLGASGQTNITYNGSTTLPTSVGKYAVKVTSGTKTASGTLSINKAPLWVRAENQRRLVSQPDPTLTYIYQGFLGTDTSAALQSQPTISTTAKLTSPTGAYPISTKGGTAANYAIIHIPGSLIVDGFGTSYEALLSDVSGRAAGKVEVTLNATCTSFSAKVATALDIVPMAFAGTMTVDALDEEASGQKIVANTKSGVTHRLNLTVNRTGTLSAVLTRSVGTAPAVILQTLDGHGRRLLPKPATPLTYAGAYTMLLEPAQPAPAMPVPTTPVPGGSGWARATISNAGLLSLTGILGDGTSFTASLSVDAAAEPGYRLFIQPYKPARTGTFLSGAIALAEDPRLSTRKYLPEAILHWAKSAETKDPSYTEGFANLNVTTMMDRWQVPSKTNPLPSLLGLNDSPLLVNHGSTGGVANDASLPTSLNLNGATLVVPDAKNNPSKWVTTLNTTTGHLTGSFELINDGNLKRLVKFTGILRQPVQTGDRLIGGGHFVLPPASGGPIGIKPTTGDLMFLKPVASP